LSVPSVIYGVTDVQSCHQAPQASGDVTYESSVPGFELVIGSYQPADVTILRGTLETSRIPGGSLLVISIQSEVRGEAPCLLMPVAVTTLTPDVCIGRSGETSWEEVTMGDVRPRAVTAGTCRLNVGVVGGTARKDIEVAYEFLP
jgi:hypothetical protein